jgi:hypothetical protein
MGGSARDDAVIDQKLNALIDAASTLYAHLADLDD